MKLIVRSSYWGPIIKGKASEAIGAVAPYIIAQACDESDPTNCHNSRRCSGCCPNYGKRVISMEEYHFLDFHGGTWDLYETNCFASRYVIICEFILIPRVELYFDMIERGTTTLEWKHKGMLQAGVIRMDLSTLLDPYLSMNQKCNKLRYHCHVRVVMNNLNDRIYPFKRGAGGKKNKVQNSVEPST